MGKGKGQHNNSNGWGNNMMMKRGMRCSYGFMLLLGFGIAVFGAMLLHKLRERRIFDLNIKEKDQQLFSLHLLLEKERDYVKEIQQKTKEMRAKIYSLRTQKMNLDNRILEMRSMISSMKDEQRTIEMALEEKQNEINQLTKTQLDYIKLTPLTDTLNQKKAETEGIKQHIDQPVKVWSVSADDPSNPKVNVIDSRKSKEMAVKAVNYIDVSGNESSRNSSEGKSNQGGDIIENEEQIQKLMRGKNVTSTTDYNQGENTEKLQVGGGSIDGNDENTSYGTVGYKSSVKVGKSRDAADDKDDHLEVHESSVETGNEKSGVKYRGGVKLQIADNDGLREKNIHRRKGKGKKLGIAKHGKLERTGRSEEIGVVRIGGRRFGKGALESERNKIQQDGENDEKKQLGAKKADDFTNTKFLKPEVSAVTRSMSNEGNTKADQPVEDVQEKDIEQITSENHNIFSDDQVEDGQPDEVHKEYEQRDSDEVGKSSQEKTAEKDEVPEDLESEDLHEPNTGTSRESSSTLKDDKEEYKEETNEPDSSIIK